MTDVLITGGTGQVGGALARLAWPDGIRVHAPPRSELDLTDPASIERVFGQRSWSAVLSCGAFTAVDRAETEVATAWTVNAVAPAVLASLTGRAGIPILHVSTDYVFSGDKDAPYLETDPVAPANVYGASKEGGEQAVRTGNPRHTIVRTAWVVSASGANFVKTMLRLAGDRDEVRVVSDQRGCPTSAEDLAVALRTLALRMMADPGAPTGSFHFVNEGEATWSELAEAVFGFSAALGGPSAAVVPIRTADYPTPARRPTNSRLSTARLRAEYGIAPRPWREAVPEIVAALS